MRLPGIGIGTIFNKFASGAAPFSPTDIAGLKLFLDANAGVTLVSGKIDVWADQSGQGNNAYATVAGERVTYNAANSNFNNYPTYSPLANQGLTLTTALNLGDFTIIWGSKKATTAAGYSCLVGQSLAGTNYGGDDVDNLGLPYLKNATGNLASFALGNSYASGGETTKHIAAIRRSGSTSGASLDNNNKTFVSTNSGNLNISGLYLFIPGSGYEYVGDVSHLLIYDSSLSDTDLGKVKDWINNLISAY